MLATHGCGDTVAPMAAEPTNPACVEIDVLPYETDADGWRRDAPIGIWHTDAGIHLLAKVTGSSPEPAGDGAVSVQTFDRQSRMLTSSRIYPVPVHEGRQTLVVGIKAAGAPDGNFAFYAALLNRPEVLPHPLEGILVGHLNSDKLHALASDSTGELGGIVGWDGEAFVAHWHVPPPNVTRVDRSGGIVLGPSDFGQLPESFAMKTRRYSISTDPSSGRTLMVVSTGAGPLLLWGHDREGAPLTGPTLDPVVVNGTDSSEFPVVAAVPDGGWLLWDGPAKGAIDGRARVTISRIGADGQLRGSLIQLDADVWDPNYGYTAGIVASDLRSARVILAGAYRLAVYTVTEDDRVELRTVMQNGAQPLPPVSVTPLPWGDELWAVVNQAFSVSPMRPVTRLLRLHEDCRYPAVAPVFAP